MNTCFNPKINILLNPEINIPFCTAGCIPSSKKSISHVLQLKTGGFAVILVVGGAAEVFESKPETNNIILKNRKGFARLALQHG